MPKIFIKTIRSCSGCPHNKKEWSKWYCKLSKRIINQSNYGVQMIQRKEEFPDWCKLENIY